MPTSVTFLYPKPCNTRISNFSPGQPLGTQALFQPSTNTPDWTKIKVETEDCDQLSIWNVCVSVRTEQCTNSDSPQLELEISALTVQYVLRRGPECLDRAGQWGRREHNEVKTRLWDRAQLIYWIKIQLHLRLCFHNDKRHAGTKLFHSSED